MANISNVSSLMCVAAPSTAINNTMAQWRRISGNGNISSVWRRRRRSYGGNAAY